MLELKLIHVSNWGPWREYSMEKNPVLPFDDSILILRSLTPHADVVMIAVCSHVNITEVYLISPSKHFTQSFVIENLLEI